MKLFLLSASVEKYELGKIIRSMVQGYRYCANEAEAKGTFIEKVFESKPGFCIDQILCMEIPGEQIKTICESHANQEDGG